MKPALRQAFDAEMAAAMRAYRADELATAFRHLELAHVLGQRYVLPHVRTHCWMLGIGLTRRSPREVRGQAIRIVLGALGSAVGLVPTGNTGGTNVGMFRRLPVPPDIRSLME